MQRRGNSQISGLKTPLAPELDNPIEGLSAVFVVGFILKIKFIPPHKSWEFIIRRHSESHIYLLVTGIHF